MSKNMKYKFNEDKLLTELKEYVDSTYNAHYGSNKIQATEFIIDSGHGDGFSIGNVMKYAQRYGKKGDESEARKDLMKILHYAMIALHCHDEKIAEKKIPEVSRIKSTPIPIYEVGGDTKNVYYGA